jgi:hypothetical protein
MQPDEAVAALPTPNPQASDIIMPMSNGGLMTVKGTPWGARLSALWPQG